MAQSLPAEAWRGKPIRLRAYARSAAGVETGGAALWLRVDRPDRAPGFFDNMHDRPVRDTEWRECVIEGVVDADATRLVFGPLVFGGGTADFDAFELATREGDGPWTPLAVADAGFEEESGSGGWSPVNPQASISRPTEGAREGRRFVRLAPPSGRDELFPEAPAVAGAFADVDLGSKLKARVPLTLTDGQARVDDTRKSGLEALKAELAALPEPADSDDAVVRLADVVVAWNVFRHFYPYWTEVGVDWDTRLRPLLELAGSASSRTAHRDALLALTAELRDGHARVTDKKVDASKNGRLPLALGVVENQLVVTASAAADVPVGAVVISIDGAPAVDVLPARMRLISGTDQWKRPVAAREIAGGPGGTSTVWRVDDGTGPREVTLSYEAAAKPVQEKRPEPITELSPGVWYVDLTRAKRTDLEGALARLEKAAVVFDVRGYPTDAGSAVLPHLMKTAESDQWMHVAKIVGPFGQRAGWRGTSWNVKPKTPPLAGNIVFMTDGRAISYAESVMGYIRDHHLGTIVGGPTAGANGNVVSFEVPGGFTLRFTGMRVTRHDGESTFHTVGVVPAAAASPTIAGIRAGRDEVLERALEIARAPL